MFSLFHKKAVRAAEKTYDDEDELWARMEEGRAGQSLSAASSATCVEAKDVSSARQDRRQSIRVVQLSVEPNEVEKENCALNNRREDNKVQDTRKPEARAVAPRRVQARAPPVGTVLEVQCEDDSWHRACVRKSKGAKALVVFEETEDGEEVTEVLEFPDDDAIVRVLKPGTESGASTPTTSCVSDLGTLVDEDSDEEDDEVEDSDEEAEDSDEDDEDESDEEETGVIESGSADDNSSIEQKLKATWENDSVGSTAASDTVCASESSDDDENA